MSISQLKSILTPPALPNENGNGNHWPLIDEKIKFPEDYIEFISDYGTGRIADFIALLNPFAKNDELNFFSQKKLIIEEFDCLIQEDSDYYKYNLYPKPDGLLPVGITDNGDYLFWVVNDTQDSNSWGVAIIASRSPDVEFFNVNITTFIYSVLSNELNANSFPDGFSYNNIIFEKI